ncbi:retrovirus-related pol polyprotein from transposon TNT 1-94 [Tanacetum coccineum]|uniref:Retrovirus-related pol polyprotein from transposon TNT 1-94 n=1 Tax=Tanacetum coccineum TaxID=301880 RepID=A0ABQ5E1Z0_9ASTR
MSGTIPPPLVINPGNTGSPNRVDTTPNDNTNNTGTNNVAPNVVAEDLPQLLDSSGGSHVTNVPEFDERILPVGRIAHEGPSDTRDTKIAALRLKFNAFKALEGENVQGTFTRLKILLNDLENKGVSIPQAEVNVTFINSIPRKWLSMNQTQRANNSIKNDSLATFFRKYYYEEGLVDQICKSETRSFTIQSSTSKAFISNTCIHESDSDVEEDTRSSSEFLTDLNVKFHDRALLSNQKRFDKRSGRVGSSKKPMDKSNETCFACGKQGHVQKDCLTTKTSSPSYPSSNKSFNKPKFQSKSSQQHNQNNENTQKDYKGIYKALKSELAVLTKKIDVVSKNCEKGLVAKLFDWKNLYPLKMKVSPVLKLLWLSLKMSQLKHVLDYTYVDLHYVEDQRKNLLSKFNSLKRELSSCKYELVDLNDTKVHNISLQHEISRINLDNESLRDEVSDLKKVIEKWTSRGSRKRKEIISSKEVVFTKADESPSKTVPEITYDSESECENHEPLPLLPKLLGAQTSTVSDKTKQVADKESSVKVIKKKAQTKSPSVTDHSPVNKADSSTQQLLLTLIEEIKGLKEQIKPPSDNSASISQTRSSKLTKDSGCSRHMTGVKQYLHRYSKESGPKVVFGDNSSGDTEGYGSVNYNGITFTRVAYVNGLKHSLIIISQLCDANFKVLFTKTQGTIFNQNNKVVLIAPRKRDFYVIDMSSYNEESNACFFAKASNNVNWLWHKRLSHLNFKNINKQNLVAGLPSLTFSKDKPLDEYSRKMENLNEVRVKELRSDNETEFRNHILEELCDEKGISQNFSSPLVKAFRVFNMRRQEMEETYHVTFSEDDVAITQTSTEGDEINFNENRSFPDDEFLFSIADDHPDHHEPAEIHSDTFDSQNITINDEPISGPQASVTTRSRVRDFEAASAHECLYMDVKSAFLNKKLPKEVYVQQPPGFESSEFPNYVCKLDKVPSGLKQANRAWYETLTTFLIKHKFVRGFQIKQDSKGISICQEKYVKDLLKKYELADCASMKCPMLPLNILGPDESGVSVNETRFRGTIGSLMFLTASRPDIQFFTCLCARYQANPKESHLVAAKKNQVPQRNSKSRSEKYFRVFQIHDGKLVCWSAKKQNSVAMSSAEAKYHFIRDHILKGDIELHFVSTDLQLVEIFTKPLAEPSFTRLVAELGMLNIDKVVPDKVTI